MSKGPLIRTSKNRLNLSRRTFLRGLLGGGAVALALPSFEVMLNTHGTAYADGTQLPRRFGLWFWGNGVVGHRWVPQDQGPNYTLSESLSPFSNVKDYLSVISGMKLDNGRFHHGGSALIVTGEYEQNLDNFLGGPAQRPSIDQVIAPAIRGDAPFASVQLGITDADGAIARKSNLMIYNVTSGGPSQPLFPDLEPIDAFNRLFGSNFVPPTPSAGPAVLAPRDVARGRILDATKADAARLRARLGARDQHRLDAHLQAIADLQKRLVPQSRPAAAECKKPDLAGFSNYAQKTDVMNEILRLAIACDRVRTFSYQFACPASHLHLPEAGLPDVSIHASIAHAESPPQAQYGVFVKYFMQRFASLLEKLKATPEGAGNLLDNSCIFGTSCIATQTAGGNHDNYEWPLLVAGRAGGTLKPGMHWRSTSWQNAGMVPFTCLKAMGLPATEWGTGPGYANQTVPILV